jgi:hypothetical protein
MSEGIATFKNVSMGSLCDPRKQEEILNDLWVEWVKLALELELENAVRRRFPGHSAGSYGRLARWIDELGFIASDVRFLVERLWRAIVNWSNSGESVQESRTARRPQKRIGELARVAQRHFSRIRSSRILRAPIFLASTARARFLGLGSRPILPPGSPPRAWPSYGGPEVNVQ